jgi:hypothetical protein
VRRRGGRRWTREREEEGEAVLGKGPRWWRTARAEGGERLGALIN